MTSNSAQGSPWRAKLPQLIRYGCLAMLVACALVALLSVSPGLLSQTVFIVALITLVLGSLTLAWLWGPLLLAGLCYWWFKQPSQPRAWPVKLVAITVIVWLLTHVAVALRLPPRLGFYWSQGAFGRALSEIAERPRGRPFRQWLGLQWVSYTAVDSRGGTYFQTHAVGMLDGTSYGFVHLPNQEGSPFGDISYRLYPLDNGWYMYEASSD